MSARAGSAAAQTPPFNDGTAVSVTLSIIIPTYNAQAVLADCLQSIYDNPPSVPYELLVVDDASADGTSEMVRACFPEVRLFRNEINRHYAYSNNLAIRQAHGQYLYLLNNDTIVLPQAIDTMLAFLQQHPEAGAVGSKLLNGDGTVQWSVKSLPNPGSALFGARSIITWVAPNNRYSRKHLLHTRELAEPFVAGYVSSASIMMPRRVVDEVGDLDQRLSYHVDADYCKRIADAGYQCFYLPAATIIHLDHLGGTMVTLRRRLLSLVEFHIGSYIFYRKHLQRSPWSVMHVVVVVGICARLLLSITTRALVELRDVAMMLASKTVRRSRQRRGAEECAPWGATSHPASTAKTEDC